MKRKIPTHDLAAKANQRGKNTQPYDNSSSTQRQRVLSWFKNESPRLSTMKARTLLGIMSPASRILELKAQGHKITLDWIYEYDSNGVAHRMGQYVYFGQEAKNETG